MRAEADHERRREEQGGGPIGGGAESPSSEIEGGDPPGAGPALLASQRSRGADARHKEGKQFATRVRHWSVIVSG